MEIQIHAKNLEVTSHIRDYVERKLNRLDRYLPNIMEMHLELEVQHQRQGGDRAIAQLTVRNQRGAILRAEDKKEVEIFAAVDVVTDKMYSQITRYKGKRRRRAGERFADLEPELAAAEPVPSDGAEDEEFAAQIVRRKQIDLAPMSEEEAVDQLELLQHDFFVFFNALTGAVNVVYKREDGNYGILVPNAV